MSLSRSTYRTPDLYFEKHDKVARRRGPLEKAQVDGAAFLGFTLRGPVHQPVRVSTWKGFESIFGGFSPDCALPAAVFGFFANGGREAVIVRVARLEGEGVPRPAAAVLRDLYGQPTLRVEAQDPGAWANKVRVRVSAASRPARTGLRAALAPGATEAEVDLVRGFEPGAVVRITQDQRQEYVRLVEVGRKRLSWEEPLRAGFEPKRASLEAIELQLTVSSPFGFEIHDNLAFRAGHPRDLVEVVNQRSATVRVRYLGSASPAPYDHPQAEVEETLAGGVDGVGAVRAEDFIGRDSGLGVRSGLAALEELDDVGLICLPDLHTALEKGALRGEDEVEAVQRAAVELCERRKTAVALLDVPRGFDIDQALEWRSHFDSKYAALYYPWLRVQDPLRPGATRLVPPCGHVAGLTSHVDQTEGPHRAAANLVLKDVLALERDLQKDATDSLAPEGINCSRAYRGRGIRPWGARTLSSDPLWAHLNVRRLFIMVQRTISEGCEWAVFEPNCPDTWKAVERQISAFLYQLWREGMLVGEVPEQAYFVRCDARLNPPAVRDAGEFHCEIGLAPVRPAEFIVFRIGQQAKDVITEEPVS